MENHAESGRAAAVASSPRPAGRDERLLVAGWALFVVVLGLAPVAFGYATVEDGWRFTGFHASGLLDYKTYMAWIRQAQDGHALFLDRFTSEPHGRVVFHPAFWAIGSLARLTGAPVIGFWLGVQALALVAMVVAIFRFAAEFTDCTETRLLALVLATTGSGLGWLFPGPASAPLVAQPIDRWLVEANPFLAVCSSYFTLPLGLALMLASAVETRRYLRTGRLRAASAAGLLALMLALVHPYDAVPLYAGLGAWTLLAGPSRWPGLLVVVLLSAPYLIYGLAVVSLDPVLSQVVWKMPMPRIGAIVVGFGLPLALAVLALLLPPVWRWNRDVRGLVVWIGVWLLLLALPIDFRRKLLWGLDVLFCLLAAMACHALFETLRARLGFSRRAAVALSAGVAALVCVGSVPVMARQLEAPGFGRALPAEVLEPLAWLDAHAEEGDVVLASPAVAGFVPGWAGATVFWGHWAQTVDSARKKRLLLELLAPDGDLARDEVQRLLVAHRIRWVLLDAASAAASPRFAWPWPIERAPVGPFVRPALRNDWVVILEVVPPGAPPPPGGTLPALHPGQ